MKRTVDSKDCCHTFRDSQKRVFIKGSSCLISIINVNVFCPQEFLLSIGIKLLPLIPGNFLETRRFGL